MNKATYLRGCLAEIEHEINLERATPAMRYGEAARSARVADMLRKRDGILGCLAALTTGA